jgi:uncharacterized integral membrane protein
MSIILILLLTISGFCLTRFLFDTERTFLRLAAGTIIGSAIFGTLSFATFCVFGMTTASVWVVVVVSCLPLLFLTNHKLRRQLVPWFDSIDYFSLAYYVVFFFILYFFFDRAMLITDKGIFTGGSQNLGDLPFHLGAIFSFTEGNNFPPENPSFSGAKFTYPFIADVIAATFVKLGISVREAMLAANVTWAFALVVLLEEFTSKITGNKIAGKIAPLLLFFCGGLGFVWLLKDYWQDGRSFSEFIWNLKTDYTIRSEGFRFGNSLTTLFMTQRSLLLGMPITLIVLTKLWDVFSTKSEIETEKPAFLNPKLLLFGLLAGTLPLIHLHSLIVLFIVSAFLLIFSFEKWKDWISFGIGVCVIAIPELLWAMSGTSNRATEFFGWHFGWDAGKDNILFFYLKNLGVFLPFIFLGLYFSQSNTDDTEGDDKPIFNKQLLFYLPFVFCFVIANLFKLAPWEWDNIKVLIYWFVGSIPFVALFLAKHWEQKVAFKLVAVFCLLLLISSGFADVWRVISGAINYQVFDKDAVAIAEQIKAKLPPKALILNAPTYNSAVVLSGRRSLMRYSGHLSSHGIDYQSREDDVKTIYHGESTASILIRKYGIEYVLVSPEEINSMLANDEFFAKYPIIAESGLYTLYDVRKPN